MHISSANSTAYSLLSLMSDQSSDSTTATTTAAAADPASTDAAKAANKVALGVAAHRFQAQTAGSGLEHDQSKLGTQLQAAMTKAGFKLTGSVAFSMGSDGKLAVQGSDADKATMTAFFKADTSTPSFSSKLTSLTGSADKLSASIRQNAAILQAGRYGAGGSGVMSLYTSLVKSQDTTPATFSLSASTSSLNYPGVLSTSA
jgi:hypothetical protein